MAEWIRSLRRRPATEQSADESRATTSAAAERASRGHVRLSQATRGPRRRSRSPLQIWASAGRPARSRSSSCTSSTSRARTIRRSHENEFWARHPVDHETRDVRRRARARHQGEPGEDRPGDLAVRRALGPRAHGRRRPQHPAAGRLRAALDGGRAARRSPSTRRSRSPRSSGRRSRAGSSTACSTASTKNSVRPSESAAVRYAVLSDIHGNLEALEAVLADAAPRTDALLCLGDLVGYGADPVACVEIVAERAQTIIVRQSRARASPGSSTSTGSTRMRGRRPSGPASAWTTTIARTSPRLPLVDGGGRRHARACLARSARTNGTICVTAQDGFDAFAAFATRLCFVGHSHLPGAWSLGSSGPEHRPGAVDLALERGRRYIVNVGSVGQPRDRDPRAAYAIWDVERGTIASRRVVYDVATAAQEDPPRRIAPVSRRSARRGAPDPAPVRPCRAPRAAAPASPRRWPFREPTGRSPSGSCWCLCWSTAVRPPGARRLSGGDGSSGPYTFSCSSGGSISRSAPTARFPGR